MGATFLFYKQRSNFQPLENFHNFEGHCLGVAYLFVKNLDLVAYQKVQQIQFSHTYGEWIWIFLNILKSRHFQIGMNVFIYCILKPKSNCRIHCTKYWIFHKMVHCYLNFKSRISTPRKKSLLINVAYKRYWVYLGFHKLELSHFVTVSFCSNFTE